MNTRMAIDGAEIPMVYLPKCQSRKTRTRPFFKGNHTMKFIIVQILNGLIIFIISK